MQKIKNILSKCRKNYSFAKEFRSKHSRLADNRFVCNWEDRWPCLEDATSTTGFDAHYVYHTAWAARVLAKSNPSVHVDISSCLRFATILSAFVPVQYYDYRPAEITLSNFTSGHADITRLFFEDNSIHSLSCMHVVEHIGLERYGDPFNPQGDLVAMTELQRVLARDGNLLFVVPVGAKSCIQYNAHRIYHPAQIISAFSKLLLKSFALITGAGFFVDNASIEDVSNESLACGCFHFAKS